MDAFEAELEHTFIDAGISNFSVSGMSYEVDLSPVGLLGKGFQGEVRAAKQVETGRIVAAKLMKLDTRARTEAEALSKCAHPYIVRLLGMWEAPGHQLCVLLTELCDQGELFDAIVEYEAGLPLHLTRDFFSKIAGALAHMHAAHVAHRDVKAENVLLDATGSPKLIDLGLAFVTSGGGSGWKWGEEKVQHLASAARAALAHTKVGSMMYAAPEVVCPDAELDAYDPFAADVWSLGVLLYCMLQGLFPFRIAVAELCPAFALYIERGTLPWRAPYPTPDVEAALKRMLSVSVAERTTMGEALAEEWLRGAAEPQPEAAPAPPPLPHAVPAPSEAPTASPCKRTATDAATNTPELAGAYVQLVPAAQSWPPLQIALVGEHPGASVSCAASLAACSPPSKRARLGADDDGGARSRRAGPHAADYSDLAAPASASGFHYKPTLPPRIPSVPTAQSISCDSAFVVGALARTADSRAAAEPGAAAELDAPAGLDAPAALDAPAGLDVPAGLDAPAELDAPQAAGPCDGGRKPERMGASATPAGASYMPAGAACAQLAEAGMHGESLGGSGGCGESTDVSGGAGEPNGPDRSNDDDASQPNGHGGGNGGGSGGGGNGGGGGGRGGGRGVMANATCGERRALVKRICDWVLTHCDPNKDSIVLTDAQGTQLGGGSNAILAVTDAWCNLCGYTEAEAVGQSPRLTQGVGTDLSCIAGMREAIAQGRACKVSIVNYRKGGDAFINNLTLCPIRLHGEVVVYTGILKDYSSALSRMVTLRPTQYFKMTPHYTFARGLIARPPSMPMIMDVEDDLTIGSDIAVDEVWKRCVVQLHVKRLSLALLEREAEYLSLWLQDAFATLKLAYMESVCECDGREVISVTVHNESVVCRGLVLPVDEPGCHRIVFERLRGDPLAYHKLFKAVAQHMQSC